MEQIKCGSIYRDVDGNFNYVCDHCQYEFITAQEFEEHSLMCATEEVLHEEEIGHDEIRTMKIEFGDERDFIEMDDEDGYADEQVYEEEEEEDESKLEEFEISIPNTSTTTIDEVLEELGEDIQLFRCDCCDQTYECYGLRQQHLIKKRDPQFECGECPAYYEKSTELIAHKKLHNLMDTLVCPYCSEIFVSTTKLKRHLSCSTTSKKSPTTKKHKMTTRKKVDSEKEEDEPTPSGTDGNRKYSCRICDKKYSYLHYLKQHEKRHSDNTLTHTCEYCGHEFKLRQNLRAHLRTHTGEKPYQCKLCGKAFNQPYYMTIHMRIHQKEKPYECTLCQMKFVTSSHLGRHIKGHNNIKPHKCKLCDRAFTLPGHLKDHERSQHTGERPFPCDVCGNQFARRKLLRQHKQLHGEKKYKCKYCDMVFAQSAGRRGHEIRAHNAA